VTKVTISKKLSMKVLAGNIKAAVKSLANGESVDLARVVGIARGTKTGESQFGPWTALTGDFIAESLHGDKAGNRYRTGTLFLPDVALDLVLPHVEGLAKGDGVELAFKLSAEANEDANHGYVYGAEFLTEPEENDPLEALAAKALPAPAEKEAEKAPAKK
jgi:hypothetical protein